MPPSQASAPHSGTGAPFAESKNSYVIGLEAEKQVVDYFKKKRCDLLFQRFRSPFAEVDLVFRAPGFRQLILVEVKKNSNVAFRQHLLSRRQKRRLMRVADWLSQMRWNVQLILVIVEKDGNILEIPEVFVDQ